MPVAEDSTPREVRILRGLGLGLIILTVAFSALGAFVWINFRRSVTRDALGIRNDTANVAACESTNLPVYPNALYNREVGANDYLAYAIASWNTYYDGSDQRYVLGLHSPSWKRIARATRPGGLVADYYFDTDDADVLRVLVAFRGTEMTDVGDWIANLSWLTYALPFPNQYDAARDVFEGIRRTALERAAGRRVTFVTTGHSLGGGLAQHVAFAYPCTSAAVFDASFVVNEFLLASPYPAQVVNIYELQDELSVLRRLLGYDLETATYRQFNMPVVVDRPLDHEAERLVVGMAGMVVECQARGPHRCDVPTTDLRARNVYCPTYGHQDAVCQPQRR